MRLLNTFTNFFSWFIQPTEVVEDINVHKITEGFDGRFHIVNARTGFSVTGTSYSRKRDAVRGAQRRGLSLA